MGLTSEVRRRLRCRRRWWRGETDGAVGPVVTVVGVDDVDVHEGLLRDVAEEKDGGDRDHAGVATEE